MNQKIKILIALPFLLIIASLLISLLITIPQPHTASEMKLLSFVPENVNLYERHVSIINKDLKSPINAIKAPAKDFPSIPLSDIAPQGALSASTGEPFDIKISMIVINERKIAIANGIVIREGDSISGMKVLKIERDRVLLKDIHQKGRDKWAYLEEAK